jgi:hypothetical protein
MTFGEADGVPDKTSSVPFFVCLDPSEDEVLGGDENKMHVFFFSFSLCENAGGWIGRPKDEAHGRQNSVKTSKCAAATNSLLLASSYVAWNRD